MASGRFGVTSEYLVNADDLQIKIAQGAKPGEGGQLPGHKVYPWIAKTRFSTPGVGLISPPPHHDIYSIEDIAQLIHDLKSANPTARVHVKLVAEVGVGTVAAGVAKAQADVVLISGHDGGTGRRPAHLAQARRRSPGSWASPRPSRPWCCNGLRDRIVVQVDGQLKTGRDVVIGALLGAEEFGFATAPLVVSGCIMMRVCHLDTCPVGIATQNPELRKRFSGQARVRRELLRVHRRGGPRAPGRPRLRPSRRRSGGSTCSTPTAAVEHWKAAGPRPRPRSWPARRRPTDTARAARRPQDHGLDARPRPPVPRALPAAPSRRATRSRWSCRSPTSTAPSGTLLGDEITERYGGGGPARRHHPLTFRGSAGQSFGAFVPRGVTLRSSGDANDYFGKGLSGGRVIVDPPRASPFAAEEQIIAGNVILYGATAGEVFIRGQVGERFCVRNSGATAVVEGVGDHGCEYMTGGRVVVLGPTGRNFAAGMSGGDRLRLRPRPDLRAGVNTEMVDARAARRRGPPLARRHGDRHRDETGVGRGRHGCSTDWDAALDGLREGHAARLPAGARGDRAAPRTRDVGGRGGHGRPAHGRATTRLHGSTGASCPGRRPCRVRLRDWHEVYEPFAEDRPRGQGARCMDCGIPFCHEGCPLGNLIPEWNDLVYRGRLAEALERLHATNNFPEFTGRLCPAPCEGACVLGINADPVTIERIEYEIAERAWAEGWVRPGRRRAHRASRWRWSDRARPGWPPPSSWPGPATTWWSSSGPSGPAACCATASPSSRWRRPSSTAAWPSWGRRGRVPMRDVGRRGPRRRRRRGLRSSRAGRAARPRGVSAPDVQVVSAGELRAEFDAVVLAGGATLPRDLAVPGRELAACTSRWST